MNEKLRNDLNNNGKDESFIENKVKKTRADFLKAPFLILLCLDIEDLERYSDSERANNEFIMGVQSVSASATYLLLAFPIKAIKPPNRKELKEVIYELSF